MIFAKDINGLPRTISEVNRRAGLTPLNYYPKLTKDR